MHHHILPQREGFVVDHINRNRLDNRRENLRYASAEESMRNRGRFRNNTSGYKGVHWNKASQNWLASIRAGGKQLHLGCFLTPLDAAIAYNNAAVKLHEEFASLNSIK